MKGRTTGIMVVWAVAFAVSCAKGWASDVPTAEFIAAALQDQIADRGASLQADYTITPSKQAGSGGTEVRWKVHYVWTSKLMVLDETTEQRPDSTQVWRPQYRTKYWYDLGSGEFQTLRTSQRSQVATIRHVSRLSGTRFAPYNVLETAAYTALGDPLYEALKLSPVVKGKETVDSHECWQVEFTGERFGTTTARYLAWLDPVIGFCPRKVEVRTMAPDAPLVAVTFGGYADVGNGLWFPKQLVVQGADVHGTGVSQVIDLSRIDVGHVPRPEDVCKKLPSGTRVHDASLDADYIVP